MSNELSIRGAVDTIRPISPPRDTNGQMHAVKPGERDLNTASRKDETVRRNDVPADSRNVQETSDSLLTKSLNELAQRAQSINRGLRFTVDKDLDRTVITVYDEATEEVIRQIPSEEILNFARSVKLSDAALIDVKA